MNVVIMRGIPGSGKSTWVEKYYKDALVCSADHFHMNNGVYMWKPENVKMAHSSCLLKYVDALKSCAHETIVVDNTNISAWEIAPYYAIAEAYGANVKIISLVCRGRFDFMKCAKRNVHNVPVSTVERMYRTMMEARLPSHWYEERVFIPSF